jgi:two-component system catabolic regulation response regulator CreB
MKHRILIIEDEPAIADNIVYALETEGFACRWCATGGEGLAALASAEFDLAVLDVGLPDSQGFEVCKEIRKRYELPVVFLTARAAEIDRIVGLEIGADDYVVKPFSPRELAARIKAVLRRTAGGNRKVSAPAEKTVPAASASAAAGFPFALDEERCRISYHGKALELSRNEYRLLCALLEKPGRVLSRERLMQKAWDSPESSLERTVDAHVKSLRAKLREVKPGEDPIVTHRGLGYSLKEDW